MMSGLARFFGGTVDFNDCDDSEEDEVWERKRSNNSPTDGDEWQQFHEDLYAVKPITENDLNYFEPVATYKRE